MDVKEIKLDRITGKNFEELLANHVYELFAIMDGLEERQFTISDIEADHRTILHWEKEGLIDRSKDEAKEWRKFSFFDYVWIRMLIDMRSFGVPIPVIKSIRQALFQPAYHELIDRLTPGDIDKMSDIMKENMTEKVEKIKSLSTNPDAELENKLSFLTAFEFLIINVIATRSPCYMLIKKDGEVGFSMLADEGLEARIKELLLQLEFSSTLLINITTIVDEFFSTEKFSGSTYYSISPLSRQEREIVEIIRQGGVKNINITLKDGNQFYVEVLRKKPAKDVMQQIQGIIAKNKYSRITLDTEQGKVTYINETEKIMLK